MTPLRHQGMVVIGGSLQGAGPRQERAQEAPERAIGTRVEAATTVPLEIRPRDSSPAVQRVAVGVPPIKSRACHH